jgi:hypothetical protein
MGKGGGGGNVPANTTAQINQTTIPEYARPYMERLLGKTEGVTKEGYVPYGGQRIADFTQLQQESFKNAGALGPAAQLGQGTNMATQAGIGAMGAQGQYNQMATNPYAQQAFMSPYTQNALAPQLEEARRQSDITGQQNASQAVKAGAFGGSRFGIQEAERQRALGQTQANIYGQGMEKAFQSAQQAQQFGSSLGMQGFGQGLQAAGQLGQLGQQQFAQQQGQIQAQAAAGAQQQGREQEILSQRYQDFLNQKGHQKQQLAFMSDMLRGGPLSQTSQQQFQAPPTMASQMAQLGLGAYGISQLTKKNGGIIKMAEGGIASVGGIDKLRGMISDMSPEQLAQVKEGAQDALTLGLVEEQEALNRRIQNSQILSEAMPQGTVKDELLARNAGIEGMARNEFGDTAVGEYAPEPQPEEAQMARGGLAAFAKGSKKAVEAPPPPDPTAESLAAIKAMDFSAPVMTEQEREDAATRAMQRREAALGEDPNKALMTDYMKTLGSGPSEGERNAMLAFSAMKHFTGPGPFMSQLGNAASGLSDDLTKYKKEEKESKRLAMAAQIDFNKQLRAEKVGNYDKAQDYANTAEAKREAAKAKELDKQKTLADIGKVDKELANRLQVAEIGASATRYSANVAASKPTDFRDAKQAFTQQFIQQHMSDPKNKGNPPNAAEMADINARATTAAANALKSGFAANDIRADQNRAQNEQKARDQANKEVETMDPRKRRELNKSGQMQQWIDNRTKEILNSQSGGGGGSAQPAPQAAPMPKSATEAVKGTLYQTPSGPMIWNGTGFVRP